LNKYKKNSSKFGFRASTLYTQWPIEEQTTQWPTEKVQKDKQRSIKHTHKTKDRVTRTTLQTGRLLYCTAMYGLQDKDLQYSCCI
jgi:hypothetical protein